MARHRDFGSPADLAKEPVTFSLGGEVFTCLPEAPSGVLNDMVAGITVDERGNRVFSAPNLIRFVTGVLRDEVTVTVKTMGANEASALGMDTHDWRPEGPQDAEAPEPTRAVIFEGDEPKAGAVALLEDGLPGLLITEALEDGTHTVATDDVARFVTLQYDKHRIVPIDQLGEIVLWLSEELSDRPTRPSARSPRGRR